jgi:hypothetical protein
LTGSSCCTAVRNSAISIANPPSPTYAMTCLPGDALDADRVRQPWRHAGQVARQVELPAAPDRPVPGRPGGFGAAVAGDDRVVGG